jgi:hypothetical protein
MSTVPAWLQSLPEMPSVWQCFFREKMTYEGKNCDSGEEVLQDAGCPQANQAEPKSNS